MKKAAKKKTSKKAAKKKVAKKKTAKKVTKKATKKSSSGHVKKGTASVRYLTVDTDHNGNPTSYTLYAGKPSSEGLSKEDKRCRWFGGGMSFTASRFEQCTGFRYTDGTKPLKIKLGINVVR